MYYFLDIFFFHIDITLTELIDLRIYITTIQYTLVSKTSNYFRNKKKRPKIIFAKVPVIIITIKKNLQVKKYYQNKIPKRTARERKTTANNTRHFNIYIGMTFFKH